MQLEVQDDEYGGHVCHSKMVKFKTERCIIGDCNNCNYKYFLPNGEWNDENVPCSPKSIKNDRNKFEWDYQRC